DRPDCRRPLGGQGGRSGFCACLRQVLLAEQCLLEYGKEPPVILDSKALLGERSWRPNTARTTSGTPRRCRAPAAPGSQRLASIVPHPPPCPVPICEGRI